jgi:hypothetical protein
MSLDQFNAAIKPKVQGSLNIAAALPKDIDFFVLLSSSASIAGNRGQANYSAGNAFIDSFARYLVSRGYPATSINLTSVLGVGWAAENQDKISSSVAYGTIPEQDLYSILEYHMDPHWGTGHSPDVCHTVAGLQPSSYFSSRGIPAPAFIDYPLFAQLRKSNRVSTSETATQVEIPIRELLESATSYEAAADHIKKAVLSKLSKTMSIAFDDLDSGRTLVSYGVDSLISVDFKTWMRRELSANVPVEDILGGDSIDDLSEKAAKASDLVTANVSNGTAV